jgi:hypothetical protein
MVGLGRLERPTSPLSGVRSNHLSYKPETTVPPSATPVARCPERRETKTAASRQRGLTDPVCFFRASRRSGQGPSREEASLERR